MFNVFACGCFKICAWFVCDVLYGAVWCVWCYGFVFVCGLFKRVCVLFVIYCVMLYRSLFVLFCGCVCCFVYLLVWFMCDRWCDVVWFVLS